MEIVSIGLTVYLKMDFGMDCLNKSMRELIKFVV